MRPLWIWIAICMLNFAVAWLFDTATQPEGVYYLDFSGGNVHLDTMFPFGTAADIQMPPFRAGDLAEAAVLAAVRADFARWPAIRIERGESHEHIDGNVVFIGDLTAAGLFGMAEKVDVGDISQNDKAVVFASSIVSSLRGLPAERLQAIANVVSHEIGHLLGFSHTIYRDDIMVQGFFRNNQAFRLHQQSYVDSRVLWWARFPAETLPRCPGSL